MKDTIAAVCLLGGVGLFFQLRGHWEESKVKDYTIQQQHQIIQQLQAEQRGMERALGYSR